MYFSVHLSSPPGAGRNSVIESRYDRLPPPTGVLINYCSAAQRGSSRCVYGSTDLSMSVMSERSVRVVYDAHAILARTSMAVLCASRVKTYR